MSSDQHMGTLGLAEIEQALSGVHQQVGGRHSSFTAQDCQPRRGRGQLFGRPPESHYQDQRLPCPRCGAWSSRVHGACLRLPADLPSEARHVVLCLHVGVSLARKPRVSGGLSPSRSRG